VRWLRANSPRVTLVIGRGDDGGVVVDERASGEPPAVNLADQIQKKHGAKASD
jgi:hypothetical protein